MYIESTWKKCEAGQSFHVQHEYLPCTNNCARHFLYKKIIWPICFLLGALILMKEIDKINTIMWISSLCSLIQMTLVSKDMAQRRWHPEEPLVWLWWWAGAGERSVLGRGLLVATKIVMREGGVCTCLLPVAIWKLSHRIWMGQLKKTKPNLTAFYSELSPSASKGQFVHENKDWILFCAIG